MAARKLSVVAGALSSKRMAKAEQPQNDLARRWRSGDLEPPERPTEKHAGDVVPLLDGWIRHLEREVGLDPAANGS
jgi:hypothetical protein